VPLLPIHILWVNLVTDGLPALALGVDPVDPGIMNRPPRKPNEPVVTKQRMIEMLYQGAIIAFCSLFAFTWVLLVEKEPIEMARSAAFIVLSCSQLFHAFNCRNRNISLFKIGILTNFKLLAAVLISFTLQICVVYVPFFQGIFRTASLTPIDWILVIVISSLPLWFMEVIKFLKRPSVAAA
jgi:Ca2+-transporting ATPase